MNALAQTLKAFVEEHFEQARKRDSDAFVRPILVGPPPAALEALFDLLTSGGTTDWQITTAEQQLKVPVLLVRESVGTSNPTTVGQSLSRRCYWDYAVTVRNSSTLVLMLATPAAWDNRPESLANTTETLGSPTTGRRGFRDSTWKYLLRRISVVQGLDEAVARFALQESARQVRTLESTARELVPWTVADTLLGAAPATLSGIDVVNAAAGFAATGSSGASIEVSAETVKTLASFFGRYGFTDGIDKLKSTSIAQSRQLDSVLDGLLAHLTGRVTSATNFESTPAWHYRPGDPIPAWWHALDAPTCQSLLEEADDQRPVKLGLTCENAINTTQKLAGEPFIVPQTV